MEASVANQASLLCCHDNHCDPEQQNKNQQALVKILLDFYSPASGGRYKVLIMQGVQKMTFPLCYFE